MVAITYPVSTENNLQTCLVIGTPCYGRHVTDLYAASLLKLQLACQQRDIRLVVHLLGGEALITRARQNVVAQFLGNPEATHLLFIDADIGFEPEQVFRLMDFDADVTAAIYPVKRIDWKKVAAVASSTEPQHSKRLRSRMSSSSRIRRMSPRQ